MPNSLDSGNNSGWVFSEVVQSTDPVLLVKTILKNNWNSANTDGITPVFRTPKDPEEQRGFSRSADIVKVYTDRPREKRRIDGRFDFATWMAFVTVEGITEGTSTVSSPEHGEKMRDEVERIINLKKLNPDSYWEFMYSDVFTIAQEYKKFFRFLKVVVVQRIAAAVPGFS